MWSKGKSFMYALTHNRVEDMGFYRPLSHVNGHTVSTFGV